MSSDKDIELLKEYCEQKKPYFKKHKALEYKKVNRECKFYHYKQAGLFTYALHQIKHKPPEWVETFKLWKENNNGEMTGEMAIEIVNNLENKYTFDFITTTPERYDRKDYHPSTELAKKIGELIGIKFKNERRILWTLEQRSLYYLLSLQLA